MHKHSQLPMCVQSIDVCVCAGLPVAQQKNICISIEKWWYRSCDLWAHNKFKNFV